MSTHMEWTDIDLNEAGGSNAPQPRPPRRPRETWWPRGFQTFGISIFIIVFIILPVGLAFTYSFDLERHDLSLGITKQLLYFTIATVIVFVFFWIVFGSAFSDPEEDNEVWEERWAEEDNEVWEERWAWKRTEVTYNLPPDDDVLLVEDVTPDDFERRAFSPSRVPGPSRLKGRSFPTQLPKPKHRVKFTSSTKGSRPKRKSRCTLA